MQHIYNPLSPTLFVGILVVILFVSASSYAQDGVLIDYVGTTRDNSAVLDVRSTTQGALVPRLTFAQRNLIVSPATSLLIFQTDNAVGNPTGYYYNSGTPVSPVWTRFFEGAGNDNVTGTGAATRVAFWNGTNTLTSNGLLYWDNVNNRLGIGNAAPAYNLDVSGNTRTTGDFYGDIHVDDTRAVNDPPTTYNNEVAFDFKQRSVIGVPGSGTYSGNMTIAPWGDDSGDASHQLNFNEGGLFWRQGQPNSASWDPWYQILTTANSSGTTNYVARWTSPSDLGIGAIYDNGTNVGVGTTDVTNQLVVGGWIGRTAHNNGGLVGSYNNVGPNSPYSNPIYTIGNNYKPNVSDLANMYGIGYSHTNASFITDPGPDSWGMYVAADGDARIWLAASAGGSSYFNAGNVGIGTTTPSGTLEIEGDFFNQELTGTNVYNTLVQNVAWNAGATVVDLGTTDYVRVVKGDGQGTNNSSILIVATITVTGNTISFADGIGGYQQVQALMNGMATFTIELQRGYNNAGYTTLIRQSSICGLAVGDWYSQYNGIANMQGKHGDEYRFPNSVSISYFDDPADGNVDYRLRITPGGSNKNGGNYQIIDRNLTAVQIKR